MVFSLKRECHEISVDNVLKLYERLKPYIKPENEIHVNFIIANFISIIVGHIYNQFISPLSDFYSFNYYKKGHPTGMCGCFAEFKRHGQMKKVYGDDTYNLIYNIFSEFAKISEINECNSETLEKAIKYVKKANADKYMVKVTPKSHKQKKDDLIEETKYSFLYRSNLKKDIEIPLPIILLQYKLNKLKTLTNRKNKKHGK